MLYIVPTPIGNLKDITLRAIETLQYCDMILAEDTRVTKRLLNHYEIDTPLRSYHAHNEHKITNEVVGMLMAGKNMALVSDAGTPGISDPGFMLVKECHENDIKVISLPGASASISAIAGSGLPSDKFHFEGFLPHKKGRNKRWEFLSAYPYTIVIYESPFRIVKLLKEICINLGEERKVTVVREISKIYEESVLDSCKNHLDRYLQKEKIKGEFVVVISGI
jgi:16S rRNA (cytidine1402-2'-O)-methyltransferase